MTGVLILYLLNLKFKALNKLVDSIFNVVDQASLILWTNVNKIKFVCFFLKQQNTISNLPSHGGLLF